MQRITLHTANDVIDAFGGPKAMAAWAGVKENAICHYRHRGLPPSLHLRLTAEAARRGWSISAEAFELTEEDASVLASIGFPLAQTCSA